MKTSNVQEHSAAKPSIVLCPVIQTRYLTTAVNCHCLSDGKQHSDKREIFSSAEHTRNMRRQTKNMKPCLGIWSCSPEYDYLRWAKVDFVVQNRCCPRMAREMRMLRDDRVVRCVQFGQPHFSVHGVLVSACTTKTMFSHCRGIPNRVLSALIKKALGLPENDFAAVVPL